MKGTKQRSRSKLKKPVPGPLDTIVERAQDFTDNMAKCMFYHGLLEMLDEASAMDMMDASEIKIALQIAATSIDDDTIN